MTAFPTAALAGDWYVDDAGDCSNGDGSQGNPFCLIMDAVGLASNGDTIFIAPGTYFENLVLNKDLLLIGTGGGGVTIVDGMQNGSVLTIAADASTEVAGLTVTNGLALRGGGIQRIRI